MRSRIFSLLLVAILWFPASTAAHAKVMFGKDQTIHFLQDVKLTGPNQEPLFLGYMTAIQFFLAGLYVQDEGYVLGVKGDSKKFFRMPTGDELKGFQQRGLLPDPLPPYSLGFFDYLIGYSLWLVLAVVVLWGVFDWQRKRKAREAAPGWASTGVNDEPLPTVRRTACDPHDGRGGGGDFTRTGARNCRALGARLEFARPRCDPVSLR